MDKLLDILKSIKPHLDYENEENLVDDGLLDSFDIITIIAELNEQFGVSINVNSITPENLNSAKAIWKLISRMQKQ